MEELKELSDKMEKEFETAVDLMEGLEVGSGEWSYHQGRAHMANQAVVYILKIRREMVNRTGTGDR